VTRRLRYHQPEEDVMAKGRSAPQKEKKKPKKDKKK